MQPGPELFVSRAKAPLAQRSKKSYGDENGQGRTDREREPGIEVGIERLKENPLHSAYKYMLVKYVVYLHKLRV